MQAMRRGEDWALGPRDRGPAKKLARDYVDAHRRPMEYYMYALIVLIIALFAGRSSTGINAYMQNFLIAIIVVIAVDAYLLRRSVIKVVSERLPKSPPAAWASTSSCAAFSSAASAPRPRS